MDKIEIYLKIGSAYLQKLFSFKGVIFVFDLLKVIREAIMRSILV